MMIDDDDVALRGAAPHLGDEAMLPLFAFLAETTISTRIELVPKSAGLGQFRKFGAVPCMRRLFPCGDGAVVFDLFQTAEHGLIREIEKLFATEIVVAPLHVADAQLPVSVREQRLLKCWHVFEEKLLLQIFRAGRDDDSFA